MDWLGWLGWLVAGASLLHGLWQDRRDRYRLVINVRYIPEASSYIIEARNIGRRPITITGAGLGGVPSSGTDRQVYVWSATGAFPQRVEEGDAKYFRVEWGEDVADRHQASRAWVHDASARAHVVPLAPVAQLEGTSPPPTISQGDSADLATEQVAAQLYQLDVQREHLREVQAQFDVQREEVQARFDAQREEVEARLAYLAAQVDFYSMVAEREHEKRLKKETQKPPDAGSGAS